MPEDRVVSRVMKKHMLLKKKICGVLAVMMIVSSSTYYGEIDASAKPHQDSTYVNYGRKTSRVVKPKKSDVIVEETTREETTVENPEEIVEKVEETTREEAAAGEPEATDDMEKETAQEETTQKEASQEENVQEESVKEESEQTETVQGREDNMPLLETIHYYTMHLEDEAQWLWTQQLDNGAFAFYNEQNGSVYVNPYFSEITAIALIKHDQSPEAQEKMRKYLEWHFAHLNTAEEDYNGLAGTIYDYDLIVKDGEVISETSKGSYDSTDSYAALFLVALNEYVNSYGDEAYIVEHKDEIDAVVNVIYATMAENGYTYAKPDYKICYLMDNSEVYAGLVAARDLYRNVIGDEEMAEKLTASVNHYRENFEKDWWKGDHYAATISKSTCSENTTFSWDNFYPCVTAQLFPVLFDLPVNEAHTQMVYDKIDAVIDWQNMEYVTNGTTVFYWCNFATYAAKLGKFDDLAVYMSNYQSVIDGGRRYPLYSSESAKILEACDIIRKDLEQSIS